MGGRIFKPLGYEAHRMTTEEYWSIYFSIQGLLDKVFFRNTPSWPIKEKLDHGDLDIVVSDPKCPDWKEKIQLLLESSVQKSNSNVHSFLYKDKYQVDLVFQPTNLHDWSHYYLSANDRGNLIGRVARHIGFCFGGEGFKYQFSANNGNFTSDLLLTDRIGPALEFIGYEHITQHDTFEDLFQYITTSPIFDPSIYLLENRNQEGRHRDKQRKTYLAFLEWLQKEFPNMEPFQQAHKSVHLYRAFKRFPDFLNKYKEAQIAAEKSAFLKAALDGNAISQMTGLEGPDLGKFIRLLKGQPDFEATMLGPDLVKKNKWILELYSLWC